jgi:hypothetical protein
MKTKLTALVGMFLLSVGTVAPREESTCSTSA